MGIDADHPLQTFWNLAAAPMQVDALQQAIEQRLFAHLTQPASAAHIAHILQLQPDSTAVWLDMLWSMGLLHRHAGIFDAAPDYVATEIAAQFFSPESVRDCAAAWQYRREFLAQFSGQWPALLREGIRLPDAAQSATLKQRWAQAARTHLGQEQRVISTKAVLALLKRLPPLPPQGRFADIGGGPGHVTVALAQHLPGWHGVLLEQADTAAVAQETIEAAGVSLRLSSLACDVDNDSIGSGYDLIWCSSVLHFLRDPAAAVQRMLAALNPGGHLLLAHAELSADPAQAAQVMPFYAGVMLRGGRLPHAGDIPRWMHAAGCSDIRSLGRVAFPLAPVWVHSGQRA